MIVIIAIIVTVVLATALALAGEGRSNATNKTTRIAGNFDKGCDVCHSNCGQCGSSH